VIEVQISIEKFQTTYLKLIEDIQKYHSEIIITKFGKPIAKLMPIVDEQAEKPLFGYMKDFVLIHEDILEPIGENWEVDE
jgi:antitoxin (DNA-binding transcriptional repressor) of toxin-antitoxin stability system